MARAGREYYLVKAVLVDGVWKQTPTRIKTKKEATEAIRLWLAHHAGQKRHIGDVADWDLRKIGDVHLATKGDQARSIALHEYTNQEWPSWRARVRDIGGFRFLDLLGGGFVTIKTPKPKEAVAA